MNRWENDRFAAVEPLSEPALSAILAHDPASETAYDPDFLDKVVVSSLDLEFPAVTYSSMDRFFGARADRLAQIRNTITWHGLTIHLSEQHLQPRRSRIYRACDCALCAAIRTPAGANEPIQHWYAFLPETVEAAVSEESMKSRRLNVTRVGATLLRGFLRGISAQA